VNFGSVITAMVTPFKDDGKVNYEKAQELAAFLMENGSDSIIVTGTTGEASTLSWQEKVGLYKAVKEAVGNNGFVIANTGDNETATSVLLTKEAEKIGVDGVLAVVPYYNKPPQEGMFRHFKEIAECTELPVMLYNVPSRTSSNLLPETVERLAHIKNINSIKESSGSMNQVSELRERLPEFTVYSGDDSLTLPMLSLGCSGVVSVASHLVGKEIKSMVERFLSNDYQGALAIHLHLLKLFKILFVTTNPIPVKTALNQQGWELGGFRLPLVSPSPQEEKLINNVMVEYGLK
jgi:4-hydroxy-tetrahydrodipicolinate synthase